MRSVTERRSGRQMAYDHYLDEEGQPLLQPSSVLFWDLQGISAMSQAAPEEALAHLRGIRAAVASARERVGTEEPDFMSCSTWFTDNVVVASPLIGLQDEEQVLGQHFVDAAYMQLYVLRAGYLSRGAVTFGPHYMDDTFVFGPALIEAVGLEKDHAGPGWPCVTVSETAANMARNLGSDHWGSVADSPFASDLKVDEQARVFVDQLGIWLDEEDEPDIVEYWMPRYKELILRRLAEFEENSRVWRKWRWLADYHDYTLAGRGVEEPEFVIGLDPVNQFAPFTDAE